MSSQELRRFVMVHSQTNEPYTDLMMTHDGAAQCNDILIASDSPWRWLPFAEQAVRGNEEES